jgi:hypothetical protein
VTLGELDRGEREMSIKCEKCERKMMRKIVVYDRFSYKGKANIINGSRERRVECEGLFHCFMQEADGPVAVVELGDGTVETWPADQVKFVEIRDKEIIRREEIEEALEEGRKEAELHRRNESCQVGLPFRYRGE